MRCISAVVDSGFSIRGRAACKVGGNPRFAYFLKNLSVKMKEVGLLDPPMQCCGQSLPDSWTVNISALGSLSSDF